MEVQLLHWPTVMSAIPGWGWSWFQLYFASGKKIWKRIPINKICIFWGHGTMNSNFERKAYKQSVTWAIKLIIAIQNHNEMSLHKRQMAVIKGQRVASVEDGVQDKDPVSSVDKNVDWYRHYGRLSGSGSGIENRMSMLFTSPSSEYLPTFEINLWKKKFCPAMLTVAIFTNAKLRNLRGG